MSYVYNSLAKFNRLLTVFATLLRYMYGADVKLIPISYCFIVDVSHHTILYILYASFYSSSQQDNLNPRSNHLTGSSPCVNSEGQHRRQRSRRHIWQQPSEGRGDISRSRESHENMSRSPHYTIRRTRHVTYDDEGNLIPIGRV